MNEAVQTIGKYRVEPGFEEIVRFCLRHGIKLLEGELDLSHGPPHECIDVGPAGGGCDIMHRKVWIEGLYPHELLHEVMHVFLAVPYLPIDKQPNEHVLLMPIERAYGKLVLDEKEFESCVSWQEQTGVGYYDGSTRDGSTREIMKDVRGCLIMELGSISNYEREGFWLRAMEIGRQLGVLDRSNQPTFQAPDWNAITDVDRIYLLGPEGKRRTYHGEALATRE